jgi:hypothetical protein
VLLMVTPSAVIVTPALGGVVLFVVLAALTALPTPPAWLIAQRQSFVGIYPHEQTACEWLRVRQRDVNNGAVASPAHLQAALFEHLQDCAVAGQDFGDQLIETGLARDR